MTQERVSEDKITKARKPPERGEALEPAHEAPPEVAALHGLQQQVGNRAVQRLLAQRASGGAAGDGAFDLDDQTAGRINAQRGGGQALDSSIQAKMGEATGHDFGGVRVHTGPESHTLNEQLGAKAFTTGQDVFFRDGAYDPGSSGGQELLAHELTHVVQQSSGAVGGGGGGMTVNAPGDAFEQEADAVARSVMGGTNAPAAGAQAGVQRQVDEEEEPVQMAAEEEEVQMQAEDEEEIRMKPVGDGAETLQRQTEEEEPEEAVQMQPAEEEEELSAP